MKQVFAESIQYTTLAPLGDFLKETQTINGTEYLGVYLNNMYKLGIVICTGLAVLMIVIGGVQMMSSDSWSKNTAGKEKIWAAVLGLLIALGSYLLLNTINPQLLSTRLDLGKDIEITLEPVPIGERTAEEREAAAGTPGAIPEADPNFTPEFDENGAMKVRSTYYYAGEPGSDEDTNAYKSSTGTPLRYADENTVGVAAVDERLIPYGSIITVQTSAGKRYYVAADTGGAVRSRQASGGKTAVVDFFSKSQVGEVYTNVSVQPYKGTTPYKKLPASQKESFFKIENYK